MKRALLALALAACSKKGTGSFALVSIDAAASLRASIQRIHVTVSNNGSMLDRDVTVSNAWPHTFIVDLGGHSGTLHVAVTAHGAGADVLGSGSGDASIVADGETDVSVSIEPAGGRMDAGMPDAGGSQQFGEPCGGGVHGDCAAGLVCVHEYPSAPWGVCGSNPGCTQGHGMMATGDSCGDVATKRCVKFPHEPMAVCLKTCIQQRTCAAGLACDLDTVQWTDGFKPVCAMPACETNIGCAWYHDEIHGEAMCLTDVTATGTGPVPAHVCTTVGAATGRIGGTCATPMMPDSINANTCPPHAECLVNGTFPSGYCTIWGCSTARQVAHELDCPMEDSVCATFGSGDSAISACRRTCASQADCADVPGTVCCSELGAPMTPRLCTQESNCVPRPCPGGGCPNGGVCVGSGADSHCEAPATVPDAGM